MKQLALEKENPFTSSNHKSLKSELLTTIQPLDYAEILKGRRILFMGTGPIAYNTVLAEHLADQAVALRELGVTHFANGVDQSLKGLDVIDWHLKAAGIYHMSPNLINTVLRQNPNSNILALVDTHRLLFTGNVLGDTPLEIEENSRFIVKALLTGGSKGTCQELLTILRRRKLRHSEFMVKTTDLENHFSYLPITGIHYIIHLPGLNDDHA